MTNEITAAQQIVKRSQIQMIWNRFRKNKTAVLGLFLLSAIILIALCAPLLVDYKVDALEQNISERLLSPGSGHLLGTDQFGRDLFARIIYGARISLSLGFGAIFISVTIGILLGSVSGYYGGKIDNFIMRIMDVFLAIPHGDDYCGCSGGRDAESFNRNGDFKYAPVCENCPLRHYYTAGFTVYRSMQGIGNKGYAHYSQTYYS